MEIHEVVKVLGIFILGLSVGSFLNVVIYRIPRDMSIVYPPSTCPSCKSRIKWLDNIPIISYLLLRGRCRYCGSHIGMRYQLVELITGISAVLTYTKFGFGLDFLFYFYFVGSMIALTFIDIEFKIIPDQINFGGLFVGLVFSVVKSIKEVSFEPVISAIVGSLVGAGFLFFIAYLYLKIRGIEGLGMGDVKLLTFIGSYTGWFGSLFTIFFGSLVGAVVGVVLIKLMKKDYYYEIPFGPFLALAGLIYLFFGEYIEKFYFGGTG
ncbi:MAG: prepilin peptidase [Hydrogenothermaceae bacterium]|nr:prepilin peptidase [Hydrogenothermaceae bacterium]